ncbi:MAG TPA: N-acetyltransferase [Verrucomicrobiae bacterium]|nr:N-acetyltransferase [Verrucomicrobiae bacterium]
MPSNVSSPLPALPSPISLVSIEAEGPGDSPAIEALLDEAFGADRHKKQSYRYRQHVGPVEALSLVARDRGRVVGTIRQWPVAITGAPAGAPALLLGPIGVAADRRKERIGDRLMRESLRLADELGFAIVLLVGELSYYGRFGFRSAAAHELFMPGEDPRRLQVLELEPGALAGVSGDLWPVLPKPAKARRYGT